MITNHNLFQPLYKESYLGFLIKSKSPQKTITTSLTFENISLYYQPLQSPLFISGLLLIRVALVLLAEYVQIKAYSTIKKEKGLVTNVAKLYLIVLMVAGPYWLIYTTTIELIYPVNEIIGNWFCIGGAFIGYLLFFIVATHSFIVASLRYLFIVHEDRVTAYGKEKVKKLFFILSIVVPFLLMGWGELISSEFDSMSFNNKCKGLDVKIFLIESSTANVVKRNFCDYAGFGEAFNRGMIDTIRYISCIIRQCVVLIMCFNLTEGILYFLTVSHMIRAHKETMKNLKKLLSDPAKAKRRRRINLNIQITILSWLVEFLSFFVIFLGTFILGNRNSMVTLAMQTLTAFCYFLVVPSMYLVNGNNFKTVVLESKIYSAFNCLSCVPSNEESKEENEDTNENMERRKVAENEEEVEENNGAINDAGNAVIENGNGNDENIEETVKHDNMNKLKDEFKSTEEKPIKKVPKIEKSPITSKSCAITDLEDENE